MNINFVVELYKSYHNQCCHSNVAETDNLKEVRKKFQVAYYYKLPVR